jgi:GT2 family glycosyltransferase
MQKILSVIIPTRDRLENLKALLRSLELQRLSRDRFDSFVVDDGSSDGTASFLAESGVSFVSTPGGGPARARNLGVRKTSSPLLAFINDDAEADPDWLSTAEEAFRRGVFRDAAEGDVIARGEVLPLSHYLSHAGPGGLLTCNFIVTRECFNRCGGFDERFRYPLNEDFEFFIRLRKQAELVYLPGMKVFHPVRPLPFWRTFCGALRFAWRRVSADFLLMEIHPQEYRQV